jgi:ubiquinone/menaquinone biosynthesis C-methylase UbiE
MRTKFVARGRLHIAKRRLKDFLRLAYYFPFDMADSLSGKRDTFTPPRRHLFIGSGDFKAIGKEFFRYFVELGRLRPEDRVLDVGCGIGRMAVPLTQFLTSGSYEGFDIVHNGIKWCDKTISSRYHNFHFQLADVYNKFYNRKGKYSASEYRFPFEDESFDFIFLTSVFTHMLPADSRNYLSEVSRVLKKKGRVLATYFLINDDSIMLMNSSASYFTFRKEPAGYWAVTSDDPESAVAYEEEDVIQQYATQCLTLMEPIHYGSWSGRKQFLSFQDIILAEKK